MTYQTRRNAQFEGNCHAATTKLNHWHGCKRLRQLSPGSVGTASRKQLDFDLPNHRDSPAARAIRYNDEKHSGQQMSPNLYRIPSKRNKKLHPYPSVPEELMKKKCRKHPKLSTCDPIANSDSKTTAAENRVCIEKRSPPGCSKTDSDVQYIDERHSIEPPHANDVASYHLCIICRERCKTSDALRDHVLFHHVDLQTVMVKPKKELAGSASTQIKSTGMKCDEQPRNAPSDNAVLRTVAVEPKKELCAFASSLKKSKEVKCRERHKGVSGDSHTEAPVRDKGRRSNPKYNGVISSVDERHSLEANDSTHSNKCIICHENCKTNDALRHHVLVNHSNLQAVATVCNGDLGERILQNTAEKPKKEPRPFNFNKPAESDFHDHPKDYLSDTIENHQRSKSPQKESLEEQPSHSCNDCNQGLGEQRHCGEFLKDPTCNSVCMICDKRCKTKAALRDHILVHQAKRYHCELCSSSFTEKCTLIDHMHEHLGVKVDDCRLCAVKTERNALLNCRRKDSLPCKTRSVTFLGSAQSKVNTETRLLKPPACGGMLEHVGDVRRRPFSSDLHRITVRHIWRRSENGIAKRRRCPYCGMTFIKEGSLTRHISYHLALKHRPGTWTGLTKSHCGRDGQRPGAVPN